LLCKLLDGMVAIEGGKSTATGALFNEIPDRLADPLFLVLLGHASGYRWLGWLAALIAVLTAYVCIALGQPQDFRGILAKQRPMAVLTVALLVQAIVDALWGSRVSPLAAAIIVVIDGLVICICRTIRIARRLEVPHMPGESA
jgi:phosphatidylglycerophosphate synthase